MSSSLIGTLTPQGLLSAAEAEQKRLEEEQAARAASLSQGAGEAGAALQQATQAPLPQLNPMAALIQSLGGNVASIIGETPRYANNAQADLNAQKDELLAKRAQNLAALKDNYDRQAMAAQSAGDLLAEAKLRKSAESVSKAWQAIHDESAARQAMDRDKANNEASAKEGALDRASREKIAGLARSAGKQDEITAIQETIPDHTTTTQTGYQFIDLSEYTGNAKNAVMRLGARMKIPVIPGPDAAALKDIDRARRDVSGLREYINGLLPEDAATRSQKYVGMKLSKLFQTNEQRAAFKTYRDIAIPILRALAGSKNLRITQKQIDLSVENLPKDDDTVGSAARKFGIIDRVLSNAELPLITRDWSKSAEAQKGSGAPAVTPNGASKARVRVGMPGDFTSYEIDSTDVAKVLKDNPGFVRRP